MLVSSGVGRGFGAQAAARLTPSDVDRVDAPTFAGTAVITCHSPTHFDPWGNLKWEVHHRRDETS